MTTFRCAGDIGDCIFAMPVIRYHGGGILFCEAASYTRQKLTWDKWQVVVPLLRAQPYIKDVREWSGQHCDYNLNDFRSSMFKALRRPNTPDISKSLCDWMLEAHGVPVTDKDEAWITVEPKAEAVVVFNRSSRYHNPQFPWQSIVDRYRDNACFIGLQQEYAAFTNLYGHVRYAPTNDFLEAAQVIEGCNLFVGNQSACHAIAEGLKKNIILEVWPGGPNCLFYRPGVIHGIHGGLYRSITQ